MSGTGKEKRRDADAYAFRLDTTVQFLDGGLQMVVKRQYTNEDVRFYYCLWSDGARATGGVFPEYILRACRLAPTPHVPGRVNEPPDHLLPAEQGTG